MFWKKKVEALKAEEMTPVAVIVAPSCPELSEVDLQTEMSDLERAEYLKVATSLGLENSPQLLRERLTAFLKSNCIAVYSYDSVVRYLDFKYGYGYARWQWRPLRAGDDDRTAITGWNSRRSSPRNGTLVYSVPYFKAIPLAVLLDVEKVAKEFPSVGFLVSDHRDDVDGVDDPFLAVTIPGIESILVMAKWDEPGFKP